MNEVRYNKNDLMFIEAQLEAKMDELDRDILSSDQINELAWKVRELTESYMSLTEEQS